MKLITMHPSSGFRLDGVKIELNLMEAATLTDFLVHHMDRMQEGMRVFTTDDKKTIAICLKKKEREEKGV